MRERFVIVNNSYDVSVLDTESENALLLSLDCESRNDASYIKNELKSIIYILNEQDNVLKKNNINL